ncbi:filamentous hemagglutinin family outer membrane protein [[Leptolyngbya] sp. PCC 7376]|uniref:beta strand repeat-containing protein n=1 Tax=[Leptolyngbya] sp. PCC 7376 TaxID=111781 RepID=UPI00029F2E0F|nr:filamentous hemagglutinin N-terminal domain-containing protein [[Leptolyngbya] sp. PCC 7376]AFY39952.1 filamentous hemagglutinin family outer membrane protein [[Leptolyngbya] sp. PCC 7376]
MKKKILLGASVFFSSVPYYQLSISAQIHPDNTLGIESSIVNQIDVNRYKISGGAQRLNNLFHSFQDFNVPASGEVYFVPDKSVLNVLTRVTGNDPSEILGTLGVEGSSNLFLINSNGIYFGSDASLDIAGSFTASTAESIPFTDGNNFSSTPTDGNELLSISVPLGVQFNSQPQSDITNKGDLSVGIGQSLTFFGNTVLNSGSLTATGGTVMILGNRVGLIDQAEVDVSSNAGNGKVLIGGDYQGLGTVPNATQTYVGPEVNIRADALADGHGGYVVIWADNITRFFGEISAQGGNNSGNGGFVEVSGKRSLYFDGEVDTRAFNGQPGSLLLDPINITISVVAPAGFNTLTDEQDPVFDDFFLAETEYGGQNIHLLPNTVGNLLRQNSLTLEAAETIQVNDSVTNDEIYDLTLRAPNINVSGASLEQLGGGDIIVLTENLNIVAGGKLDTSTNNESDSGQIRVVATNALVDGVGSSITSQVNPGGTGNSGGIDIATTNLSVQNRGAISTTTTAGAQGNAGLVKITATGDIDVIGDGSDSPLNSRIISQVNEGSGGSSGGIDITTENLDVRAGGKIDTSTGADGNAGLLKIAAGGNILVDGLGSSIASQVNQGAVGSSNGINIATNNLSVQNQGIISASTANDAQGNAGLVIISATGNIDVVGDNDPITNSDARIISQVNAGSEGNSGGIDITTGNLNLRAGGKVDTSTSSEGNAGLLKIAAGGNILVDGLGSSIASQVDLGATGNSDGISITTNNLSVLNQGFISATTTAGAQGDAGVVTITAMGDINIIGDNDPATDPETIADSRIVSQVNVGSEGNSGGINITAGNLNVTGGGKVDTSTGSEGNAGLLKIAAGGNILVDGLGSSIASQVDPGATGNSNGINISTNNLSVLNQGLISATTTNGAQGDAGVVTITATGDINVIGDDNPATDPETIADSRIISQVNVGSEGNSGGIDITAGNLNVMGGGKVDTSTGSEGNAGLLKIATGGNILVDGLGSSIASQVNPGAAGNSEGININTNNLSVQNRGLITATTTNAARGNAGLVKINAIADINIVGDNNPNTDPETFLDSRITSQVNEGAKGNSGGIDIITANLNVRGGGKVDTSTGAQGNAGLLQIAARENILVSDLGSSIASQVNEGATGSSEGIDITTNNLSVRNRGLITATTTDGAQGNAGQLKISAMSDINVIGDNIPVVDPVRDLDSRITSQVNEGSKGNSGGIDINTGNLNVLAGGKVDTSTGAEGNAGLLQIDATGNILVDGIGSTIASQVNEGATGNSEGIDITTDTLSVFNKGAVSASTVDRGTAGSVTLRSRSNSNLLITLADNSVISATTNSPARGGDLTIEGTELVTIQGKGALTVESLSSDSGETGDVNVFANSVVLDQGLELSARTASDFGGGNIILDVNDLVLLRRGSFINAESTSIANVSSGGNVDINTGFIIALFNENSDIVANAVGGNGGNVSLTANRIFGLTPQNSFSTLELRNNTSSDASASSQLGISGNVTFLNLSFDPAQGLNELPGDLVDAEDLVGLHGCAVEQGEIAGGSELVVTGKGGLPVNPNGNSSIPTATLDYLGNPKNIQVIATDIPHDSTPLSTTRIVTPEEIQLAKGWQRLPDGKIALVNQSSLQSSQNIPMHPDCMAKR